MYMKGSKGTRIQLKTILKKKKKAGGITLDLKAYCPTAESERCDTGSAVGMQIQGGQRMQG